MGGREQEMALTVDLDDRMTTHSGVPLVWARNQIRGLSYRQATDPGSDRSDLPRRIRHVAHEHGLMSRYTAFVAVDSRTRTGGRFGTTVQVPVPVPEGVRYETTVAER